MKKYFQYAAQAIVYAGFAFFLGYFADGPKYSRLEDGKALIKFSFAHSAKPKDGCRKRSEEELMALAPNMRKAEVCSRARLPVKVQLTLNDKTIYEALLEPTGLHSDGPSQTYQRITIPPGTYNIMVAMNDTGKGDGFNHISEKIINIESGQSLAIDFMGPSEGFTFE